MFFIDNYAYCTDLIPIIRLLHALLNIIQFAIPIVLILLGTIDLGKAVIASKDDEMKKAQSTLIKRIVYAVVIFLLVLIVKLVMNLVADNSNGAATSWINCWNENKAAERQGSTTEE